MPGSTLKPSMNHTQGITELEHTSTLPGGQKSVGVSAWDSGGPCKESHSVTDPECGPITVAAPCPVQKARSPEEGKGFGPQKNKRMNLPQEEGPGPHPHSRARPVLDKGPGKKKGYFQASRSGHRAVS